MCRIIFSISYPSPALTRLRFLPKMTIHIDDL